MTPGAKGKLRAGKLNASDKKPPHPCDGCVRLGKAGQLVASSDSCRAINMSSLCLITRVCCPIGKDIYKFNLAAWTLFKNGDRQFASVSLLAVVD